MSSVNSTFTAAWRETLARLMARDVVETHSEISWFKVGEGGFTLNSAAVKIPRPPDAARLDLESEGERYPLGTATFTNGSSIVTGSGTQWLSGPSPKPLPGHWVRPGPLEPSPRSIWQPTTEIDTWNQVSSVASDTQLVLTSPYTGPTVTRKLRFSGYRHYTFRKILTSVDVTKSATSDEVDVSAVILPPEGNTNFLGNPPEYLEIGLFDANGVMVSYGTFDMVTKTAANTVTFQIKLKF